ncbi:MULTISPECIES: hypothetical protein [Vibrio]|uniref:hypothetical protein n=1 Tax=Vibrio TaxID=662 RepID=UPI000841434D|nr:MULTISPECIES: hypothetical protein [Vibrio]EGR0550903.1 hypothetical protein [Vibrio cholerae]EGR4177511.1 hypothetical protein [Vibrio cholerae]EHB5529359.1 hypothetical protein [Vibrio cholerae]EII3003637.1 hypothetical protein [Vibrio cholerae]EJL6503420.1 hypothetical protein [Vibrio cholerae]
MAGIIFSNSLKLCFVSEETKHYMVSGISHYEIKQYAHGCLDNGSQKREASNIRRLLNSVDFEHVVTEDCKYTDMDRYESIGFKILNTRRNRSNRA